MPTFPEPIDVTRSADCETVCGTANIAGRNRSRPWPRRPLPTRFRTALDSGTSAETSTRQISAADLTPAPAHPEATAKKSPTPAVTTCRECLQREIRDDRFQPEIRGENTEH